MRSKVAAVVACATCVSSVWAAPKYLADFNPTGIPDISQDQIGICAAAAAANILWEWDRNAPFDGTAPPKPRLVPRTDATWPAAFAAWVTDGRNLRNALATEIYGPNYTEAKPKGGHGMPGGITRYINSKSHLYNSGFWPFTSGNPTGLSVHTYNGNAVTYTRLKNLVVNQDNDPIFSSAILNIDWRTAAGDRIAKENKKVLHSLGMAGFDTANTDLYLTNGWGNHENQANPVSNTYYDHYTGVITDNTGGGNANNRIRIPANANNNNLVGLPGRFNPPADPAASYVEVYQLVQIKQGGSPSVGLEVTPADSAGFNEFSYSIYNDEPNAQKHFFLELPAPLLSLATNITMPSGWAMEQWIPGGTVADPTGMNTDGQLLFGSMLNDESGSAPGPDEVPPDFTGIHFYYNSASPGGGIPSAGIGEFSFDLSSVYGWSTENTYLTVVGEAGNEIDYFNMIGGPVIPEPGTCSLVIAAAGALLTRRRQR